MIGTRTPFRVSFAGGGSDFKEFYSRYPGCVLSTTINQYMFIFVHPFFDERIQVKYSKTELVTDISEIKHPIVREVLRKYGISGIDINAIADIPAGTGLGSSCSFTVGLLHALHAYSCNNPTKEELAKEACEIEIDVLEEPIGKQDQYSAAYGGLNFITFHPDDTVSVEPVIISPDKHREFENSLMFFYLGGARPAREILADQKHNIVSDKRTFSNIKRMTDLTKNLRDCLSTGELQDVGPILDEGWSLKKDLTLKISDDKIDFYYNTARNNGASGGKLLGAGGRGFLMFYCEMKNQDKLRQSLKNLKEFKFKFDSFGTKVIYNLGNKVVL